MRLVWAVIPLVLVGILGISSVDARCLPDQPCTGPPGPEIIEITSGLTISNAPKLGETAELILYYEIKNVNSPIEIHERFWLPVGFVAVNEEEHNFIPLDRDGTGKNYSFAKTITESGHYQHKITIKALHEGYWSIGGGISEINHYNSHHSSGIFLKVGENESLIQDTQFDESVVMNWPSKLELETLDEEPQELISDSKIFEYQTYQSRTHGFTIEYPTDWIYTTETASLPELRVDDIENKLVTFSKERYSSYSADIPNVAVFFLNNSNFSSNDGGITHLSGLEQLLVDHCERTQEHFRLTCIEHEIINSEIISVDGKPGYRVDNKWIGVDVNGVEALYFGSVIDVIMEDHIWSITAINTANENVLASSIENLDHIIKSLKVTDEAFEQAKSVKKTIVPPWGHMPLSNLRTIDESGNSVDSIKPGGPVIVSADIANWENRVMQYSLIFQVRDGVGDIHFINVISGVFRPGESLSQDSSFEIDIPGVYSVVLYFWEDIDRGIPISPPLETVFIIK